MSIAHTVANFLPSGLRDTLRPRWHRMGLYRRFLSEGGRIRFDRELLTFEVSRKLPDLTLMSVAVRSPREFRRWLNFARDPRDKLYRWLISCGPDAVLWDIGSANGLEGCVALHASKCTVVFVEPFTPSVESILKSLSLIERREGVRPRAEVVQAACSDAPGYGRLVTHTRPVAGETFNSIGTDLDAYCQGGRGHMPQSSVQWVKYVTLDEMHFDAGIALPTHLKVDVDGLENKVLEGGRRVFGSPSLRSCAIEVNGDHGAFVDRFVTEFGFKKVDTLVHHDTDQAYTADIFYTR